jgi:hypothetical protein
LGAIGKEARRWLRGHDGEQPTVVTAVTRVTASLVSRIRDGDRAAEEELVNHRDKNFLS